MPEPLRFDLSRDDAADALAAASAALDAGELIVVPTETVYGIAAREDRPDARERLVTLKDGRDKPFSLAVADLEMLAGRLEPPGPLALRMAERWWPGPLTMLLRSREGGRLGVRVPGHPWTRELIGRVGAPLLLPSANLPGEAPPVEADEVDAAVLEHVSVVVDGGRAALGEASTVVDVRPLSLLVLREGVVSRADLERHAQPRVLVICSGNTCRSPMAAALLRHELAVLCDEDERLVPPVVVSAGAHAGSGQPASGAALQALDEMGLDLSDHRARPVDEALLRGVDMVLGMTGSHVAIASRLAGEGGPSVELFDPDGREVQDPFGGSLAEYRRVAQNLRTMARERAASMLHTGEETS
ncbi:MAG: L-threonylcarbamoyladenylate synthase [Planctomycetota bacterium]